MTITTSVDEKQYSGNGVTDTFGYPFKIFAEGDLQVREITDATSGIAAKLLNTDYVVTGVGDSGGGNVVMTTPPATGVTLDIRRVVDLDQQTDIRNLGAFLPSIHEDAFDDLSQQIQQVNRGVVRSIRADDVGVTPGGFILPNPLDRAGKYMVFASGSGDLELATSVPSGTLSQSSIGLYLYPRTANEISVSVVPTYYYYPEGNVLRYGADPTGATDSSSAIRDCLKVCDASRLTGNSGIYGVFSLGSDAAIPCFFPRGIYTIAAGLTTSWADPGVDAINYIGDEAILVDITQSITCFDYLNTRTTIRGISFRGFDFQVKYRTQNITTTHNLIDCEFISPGTIAVSSNNDSASTQLNVVRPRYASGDAGAFFMDVQMDRVEVANGWFQSYNNVTFENRNRLRITHTTLIPPGTTTGQTWVENAVGATAFYESNNHWGGEGGGRTVLRNYADADGAGTILPVVISMKDSEMYTNKAIVELYGLPNNLTIGPIYDDSPTTADDQIWVDPSLSAANLKIFARHGVVNIDARNGRCRVTGNEIVATMMGIKNRKYRDKEGHTRLVNAADVVSTGDTSTANWTATSGAGVAAESSGTNPFLATTSKYTAGGDDDSFQLWDPDFLVPADLSNKAYTFCWEINYEPASGQGQLEVLVDAGYERTHLSLKPGRHMYSFPFVYINETGSADTDLDQMQAQAGARMLDTDVVEFGRWLLLDGVHEYNAINLQMYASAAPSAISLTTGPDQGYHVGDIFWDVAPAAAGAPGEICTTAGDPGTWKEMAALEA